MPETACLHIQSRDTDPIRVVELPGGPVRIGRAPFCEVHLPEPALAEEECQLRRRGATWHLVPVSSSGALTIEGRVVDEPRPLPYGVALRVGDFSLTLRPGGATPPGWSATARSAATPPRAGRADVTPASPVSPAPQYRPPREPQTPRGRAGLEEREKRWEARWKAAAERVRANTPATPPPPAAPVPADAPRATERLAGWRSVDLPRRDGTTTRKVARPLDSSTFPSLRAVEVPSAYPKASRPTPPKPQPVLPPEPALSEAERLEAISENADVFIAPSELDWADAEARQHREVEAPAEEVVASLPAPEAVVALPAPSFEDESTPSAASVLPDEPPAEAAAATSRSFVRPVGQALLSLWGKVTAHRSADKDEVEVEAPVADTAEAEAAIEIEAQPLSVSETPPPAEEFFNDRPEESFAAHPGDETLVAVEPSVLEEAESESAAAPTVTFMGRAGQGLRSLWQRAHAPKSTVVVPPPVEDTPAAEVLPASAPEPEPEPVPEPTPTPADEPVEVTPRPARRSFFARRRAKARTRIPRLGSVRVVPNDEARVAPRPAAPERVPAPAPETRFEEPAPPVRPRERAVPHHPTAPNAAPHRESGPFDGRTWQADTGNWTGLGAAAVSTSTWDAGVGREGHAARPHQGAARDAGSSQAWPSARDILAARTARPATPPPTKAAAKRPLPTVAREPEHFTVPLWLGWLPLTVSALGASALGVALACNWSADARTSGVLAAFVAHSKPGATFPLPPEELPAPAWWRTSGSGLAHRAVALARSDNADTEEVRALLTAAIQASPLDASARFALARLPLTADDEATTARLRCTGLSRDVLSLAWTGRQLIKAGQKESALRAYRRALELAATADVARLADPSYNDDPQVRRYTLPGEDLIGPVVHDMAGHGEWTFEEWSEALPPYAVVPLVAARHLRENDRAGSDAALDRLCSEEESRSAPPGVSVAVHIAARAEAFAVKGDWAGAQALYQQAIELMPLDRVRRSWHINVADLALRQNDEQVRQKALEAANNHDPNDPITLRVVDLQKASGERTARTRDEAVTRASARQER